MQFIFDSSYKKKKYVDSMEQNVLIFKKIIFGLRTIEVSIFYIRFM